MYIPVRIYISAIKYCSFWMFLSQSMPLGAKKGQRMMNSERDTHLYSCFFTCTNVSFRCISHSFNQNWIKFLQFIFEPLNIIAVFRCSYRSLWLWELKLPRINEFGQRYTIVQLFLHLYKWVFQMYIKFFHSKLYKIPSIYILSIK